jgi:hypothetical protein
MADASGDPTPAYGPYLPPASTPPSSPPSTPASTPPSTPAGPSPAQGPGPSSSDRVLIDWQSIRELAGLFDKSGDDMVAYRRTASPMGGTSSLVGDDGEGIEFAKWYVDGYDKLTDGMNGIADKSFTAATDVRDMTKMWDILEQAIIADLPVIPDLGPPPIPPDPPYKEGA